MPRYIQPPSPTTRRYTPEQRSEIVEFVLAWEKKHDSDGRKEAQRCFGTSPQTIDNWVRKGLVEAVSWSSWKQRREAKGLESKSNNSKRRRYTPSEKEEVLALVQKVNREKGRGGIKAASEKFGITPLIIRAWMDAAGIPSRTSGLAGRVSRDTFMRLAELHQAITATQEKLVGLKQKYAKLRRKL